MSVHEHPHDGDNPRFEPWLGVMASSFLPVVIALYADMNFMIPLFTAAAVLFLASLVMLRRQTVRRSIAGNPTRGRSADKIRPADS
ncbi:MAG TPA: hypothetical protein VN651_03850 [Gemmatimonadaceae bacterium]|nr:hypothetical protein [Gemmatimonadaceae bacterium]